MTIGKPSSWENCFPLIWRISTHACFPKQYNNVSGWGCPRLLVAKLVCHLPIILFLDIPIVPIAHLSHQFTLFRITGKMHILKAFARRQFTCETNLKP
jgi:hypothetical protein